MKRSIVLLILIPVLIVSVSANSGPTYMFANPGLEIAVSPDCPIVVDHEDLRFDLSKERGSWSPLAIFEASYSMSNPTGERQTVKMAFPYVTSFSKSGSEDVSVYENGNEIGYEVYYGLQIGNEEDLSSISFEDILSNVLLESPPEPDDGLLYTLKIDTSSVPEGVERIYIRMSIEPSGGKCFTSGFSGGAYYGDGRADLSTWYYLDRSQRPIYVYVPEGSLLNYSVSSYESHESNKPLDYIGIDVAIETVSMREFIYEQYGELEPSETSVLSEKMYWELLNRIREGDFEKAYNGVTPFEELFYYVYSRPRLAIAVFDVEFDPNGTRDITVRSSIEGTMERPSGYSDRGVKYTYTYLSNPAKHWADFGTLRITVIPPEDKELVLAESYPELEPGQDGIYHAEIDGLPGENIHFVFAKRNSDKPGILIADTSIMILAFTAAVILAIVLIMIRLRKKQKAPA